MRTELTIGELCAGYGGLGMGVKAALGGGEVSWVADVCKITKRKDGTYTVGHHSPCRAPCTVLAHRYPDAPNLGDITAVDWATVPRVDVLCGGTPCTDLSHAGKRAGMTEGTRSNLWVAMREAIAVLRPSLVVWENVGGAYSADADSDLGSDAGLLDRARVRPGRPVLRALGRVLGDLASLGFDAEWVGLRAADVGAAHGRLRVFVVAWPAASGALGGRLAGRAPIEGRGEVGRAAAQGAGAGDLLPTPVADNSRGLPSPTTDYQSLPNAVCSLLPTPAVNDMGAAYTPERWDEWTARMKAAHNNGNGHGDSLNVEAQRLLQDDQDWGRYAEAIDRHARMIHRAPPAPTETGPKGGARLSRLFDEWLMGLPDGWITSVPGVTYNETLRLCGNGVVPRQAEVAVRTALVRAQEAVA